MESEWMAKFLSIRAKYPIGHNKPREEYKADFKRMGNLSEKIEKAIRGRMSFHQFLTENDPVFKES